MNEKKSLQRFGAVIFAGGAALLVLVLILGKTLLLGFYESRALPGTKIFDMPMHGLTEDQMIKRISGQIDSRLDWYSVSFYPYYYEETAPPHYSGYADDEKRLSLTYREIGIVETEEYCRLLANLALRLGRPFENSNAVTFYNIREGGGEIFCSIPPSDESLEVLVSRLEEEWICDPVDFSYRIEENTITFTKAKNGLFFDRDVARDDIWVRLNAGQNHVNISAHLLKAQQGDLDALAQTLPGFDLDEAKRLMEEATPGESFSLPYTG